MLSLKLLLTEFVHGARAKAVSVSSASPFAASATPGEYVVTSAEASMKVPSPLVVQNTLE